MAEQPAKSRELPWQEWLPWLILVRSVRVALMARVIVLGALGLIAMTLGWRAIGMVLPDSDADVMRNWRQAADEWLWESSPDEFSIPRSTSSAAELFLWAAEGLPKAPVSLWLHLTRPFMELFHPDLNAAGFVQLLVCCFWTLVVWGVFGGAISRIAALKLTRDEAPGIVAALRYAVSKLSSYSVAPMIALGGAAVFAIQLVALGALMRWSIIAMLAGLAWPFVLLLGLLMALLLIGALVGWPLMWATVSVEGTDAFDALSRSYAYTYQRPWRLLWYVLFAGFLAAVSMFVVKLFAASAIELGNWSVDWGLDDQTMEQVVNPAPPAMVEELDVAPPAVVEAQAAAPPVAEAAPTEVSAAPTVLDTPGQPAAEGDDDEAPSNPAPAPLGVPLGVARAAIGFWKFMVNALAAGYQAGFLWASAVAVYLLLRRDIDGVEMNEVFPGQDDDFGTPALTEDAATGVPEVAAGQPARPGDTSSDL